jgi:hypothetical protein
LRDGVGIARIQNILLSQLGVITRLIEIAVRDRGAVLPLLQRAAALLHRRLRVCKAAGEQCQHAEPAHDVQMVGGHGGPIP